MQLTKTKVVTLCLYGYIVAEKNGHLLFAHKKEQSSLENKL